MVNFVVWLNEDLDGQGAEAEFARQRPTLTPIFQQHAATISIIIEGMIGVYCESPDESSLDEFKSTLPPQWRIDRSQYNIENH